MNISENKTMEIMRVLFKTHPWHGIKLGNNFPEIVTSYIEMVPADTVKYELDKKTGYLRVDRPQRFSNICPTLYGMLPQTMCESRVAALSSQLLGRKDLKGDGDPLDICILTDREITHGDVIVEAVPIGVLRMIDCGEVDDKIIAVLKNDASYGEWKDILDCPEKIISRLKHYFLTYKNHPESEEKPCEIIGVYGKEMAHKIVLAAHEDYLEHFGDINLIFNNSLK